MPSNDMFAAIATMFLLVLPFVILIVSRHQLRMAQILHESDRKNQSDAALLQEIQALRSLVAQQTILLDNLSQSQRTLTQRLENEQVSERLNA